MDTKYCTACLAVGRKMHGLNLKIMTRSASEIIASIVETPNQPEGSICYECVNFLYNYEKFRIQCIKAVNTPPDSVQLSVITNTSDNDDDNKSQSFEETDNEDSKLEEGYIKIELDDSDSDQDVFSENSSQEIEYLYDEQWDNDSQNFSDNDIDILWDPNEDSFKEFLSIKTITDEEARNDILSRKNSSIYNNAPFKCEFCYRAFNTKSIFENHIKKHSNESGKFECNICLLRFHTKYSENKHFLQSHKYKISCKLCPYFGYSIKQAKQHVSTQHESKEYKCNECEEVFRSPKFLQEHKLLHHTVNLQEAVCPFCGLTFVTPAGLHLHSIKIHKDAVNDNLGPFCSECDVQFASYEAWKRHLKISSRHNINNKCKECDETFKTIDDMVAHVKKEHRKTKKRVRKNYCTKCAMQLLSRSEYKEHMKKHVKSNGKDNDVGKKPFVCDQCGLSFKLKCYLSYHVRRHTNERPFICKYCGQRFQQPQQYYAHRAAHRHKPQCNICGRVYKYMYGLSKHMRMHLGIRPHKCEFCEKTFINRCDVKLHVKHVHEKQPWPKRLRIKPKVDIKMENSKYDQ